MIDVDLNLHAFLQPQTADLMTGARDFLRWLSDLRQIPAFNVNWSVQWSADGQLTDVWSDTERYLAEMAAYNADAEGLFSIWACEARKKRTFDAMYAWGNRPRATAELDFFRADPALGTGPMQYIDMIKVTTAWMRPQHLEFGPKTYLRLDHPLDLLRRGIGWIGWVPFALTAADVPEAVLVQQVNGGTIIMTWPDFWQAHPGARNEDAVRRTQDVEVRLNLLGVLPTTGDLAGGNWGR